MTNIRKNILTKINQKGSMMVEAMAMLALIALVTPTLYKKSAERTTELQDINTAAHIRTLSKAVDNYVAANYQELLKNELETEDKLSIDLTTGDHVLKPYLPYGYSFETLKNFGIPKVTIKKSEDTITAFVQLPKKTDIGEMRAARIASMIGSNGGYINAEGAAKGVGGVWNLERNEVADLNFDETLGSVVVASTEAINSANFDKFENEMYLQRTPANPGEEWRNTMATDLYMGSGGNLNKILGVEQLVIGSVGDQDEKYGLYIDSTEKGAYIGGALEAADGLFSVDDTELIYDGLIEANHGESYVSLVSGVLDVRNDVITANEKLEATQGATVSDELVVIGENAEEQVLYAKNGEVSLLGDAFKIVRTEGEEPPLATINGNAQINNQLKVGTGTTNPRLLNGTEQQDLKLNVQGNAFISGTLEAGTIKTGSMDLKELHAGGNQAITDSNHDQVRWLHATKDGGVRVTDITNGGKERLLINSEKTALYNTKGDLETSSVLLLGDQNAVLQGESSADVKTATSTGTVQIQGGLISVTGYNNKNEVESSATINTKTTTVTSNQFKIGAVNTDEGAEDAFYVNTTGDGEAKINVGELTIANNDLFQVLPEDSNDTNSTVKITKDYVTFTASASTSDTQTGGEGSTTTTSSKILEVNVQDSLPNTNGVTDHESSIYIRRGAIELEPSKFISESHVGGVDQTESLGSSFAADEGVGYIEASRFVSNVGGAPVVAGDYTRMDDGKYVYYDKDTVPVDYDKYMVNPAYTSVMHDIKLTTRGGARISDMLPDFINKGIYVVTNTFKDNLNINEIEPEFSTDGDLKQVVAKGAEDMTGPSHIGPERWASAFLGIIPAPQCPPGHARVVTITPAGFKMGQAGRMTYKKALNPFKDGSEENRFVIESSKTNQENMLGQVLTNGDNATVHYLGKRSTNIPNGTPSPTTIYYLGFTNEENPDHYGPGSPTATNIDWAPEPLYFQQSTWLRSKVIPQSLGVVGQSSDGENFVGWSAIMGFVYPKNTYGKIINKLLGENILEYDPEEQYFWNVFPVETGTLEGYATVYCYFDRNNIFDSGIDGKYVDQYDQLNYFRQGYAKEENDTSITNTINFKHSKNNDGTTSVEAEAGNNNEYINRLNDPYLKYNQPW